MIWIWTLYYVGLFSQKIVFFVKLKKVKINFLPSQDWILPIRLPRAHSIVSPVKYDLPSSIENNDFLFSCHFSQWKNREERKLTFFNEREERVTILVQSHFLIQQTVFCVNKLKRSFSNHLIDSELLLFLNGTKLTASKKVSMQRIFEKLFGKLKKKFWMTKRYNHRNCDLKFDR